MSSGTAIPMFPAIIELNDILLRKPIISDVSGIFNSYAQDIDVCRYLVWNPHKDQIDTMNYVQYCIDLWNSGKAPYVITHKGTDEIIGMIDVRKLGTTIDIGYVLSREYWGRGIMSMVLSGVVDVVFDYEGIYRCQATCDVDNISSQRVLEKCGFSMEGRLERYVVHPNISLEPRAVFMYAKVKVISIK